MKQQETIINDTGADELWDTIVAQYREVCVLKEKGEKFKAQKIMKTHMLELMDQWCLKNGKSAKTNREALSSMFINEHKRVENASILYDLMSSNMEKHLLPIIYNNVTQQVDEMIHTYVTTPVSNAGERGLKEPPSHASKAKRRIPFDNIADAIDSIIMQEQEEK